MPVTQNGAFIGFTSVDRRPWCRNNEHHQLVIQRATASAHHDYATPLQDHIKQNEFSTTQHAEF
jgi:hypothetical protein